MGSVLQDPRVAITAIALLFLLARHQRHWAGFWLGLLVGTANWQALSRAAHRAVWLSVADARRYMVRSYVLRYGVRFVILAAALLAYDLHPLTLLLGLTAPTVAAILAYVFGVQRK